MTTAAASATPTRPEGWWAWPGVYVLVVYLAAYLPLPWWGLALLGVAAGVGGRFGARELFHAADYGTDLSASAGWCALAAGAGAAGWLVSTSMFGPVDMLPWLALWVVVFGAWYLTLAVQAPRAAARRAAGYVPESAAVGVPPVDAADPDVARYQAVLDACNSSDVQVLQVKRSPKGAIESALIMATQVGKAKAITRTAFDARLPSIAVALARRARADGRPPITDGDVRTEPGADAAEWWLHVTVKPSFDGVVPYRMAGAPQPWAGRKRWGEYADEVPLEVALCDEREGAVHGEVMMMSNGGKTTALNVLIARQIESLEGEVWLVGTNKLVKLAELWLMPWLRGETDRPAIDRVAGEAPEVALGALRDAYHYAVLCNRATSGNKARNPAKGGGALLVIIDEASHLLERNDLVIRCHDGVQRNASQLVSAIQKIGRTAPVSVIKANQDALFDSLGDEGNKQRRNSALGVVGRVQRNQDAQSVIPQMPNVNATTLARHAVFVQPGWDAPREMPARFDFLDDDDIPEVARACTPYRRGLIPKLAAQLALYPGRWSRDLNPELVEKCDDLGVPWPGDTFDVHTDQAESAAPAADPAEEPAMDTDPTPQSDPEPVPESTLTDAEIWAWLESDAAAADAEVRPAETAAEDRSLVDAVGKFARFARQLAEQSTVVPDPLGTVLSALAHPKAPQEWVTTEQLAGVIGRFGPDADETARRRAVETLGMELFRQTGLNSQRLSKSIDPQRRKGYAVADLRAAAGRLTDTG